MLCNMRQRIDSPLSKHQTGAGRNQYGPACCSARECGPGRVVSLPGSGLSKVHLDLVGIHPIARGDNDSVYVTTSNHSEESEGGNLSTPRNCRDFTLLTMYTKI